MEGDNLNTNPVSTTKDSASELGIGDRIKILNSALESAQNAFKKASKELLYQIVVWALVCIILSTGWAYFSCKLYKFILPEAWSWRQVVYYTTIRITIITALFSLASFCFKMLKSHIHMYQKNRHKETIVKSMASFVESGRSEEYKDLILTRLTEILVQSGSTGIISKENDFKLNNFESELLEKFIKKD